MSDDLARVGSRRYRALPWAFRPTALTHRIVNAVVIDDNGARRPVVMADDPRVDAGAQRIDWSDVTWTALELVGEVSAERATLAQLVPTTERAAPPLQLVVAVRCAATRLHTLAVCELVRDSEPASDSDADTITWRWRADVRHADVRDRVTFAVSLVRHRDADELVLRFASNEGARVAAGRAWTLLVDPPQRARRRHLDVRFTSFSGSEHDVLRAAADTGHLLEADLDTPILWLNEDHADVAQVLMAKGTTGLRARTRDVLFDRIAATVWLQLATHAIMDINADGETLYEWGRQVIGDLLPILAPDLAGVDDDARIAWLVDARSDATELASMLQRLDTHLQRRDRAVHHARRLIAELIGAGRGDLVSDGWMRMTDEGRRLLSDAFLRGERHLWEDSALAPYMVPTPAPLDASAREVLGRLDAVVDSLLATHPRSDPALDAALAPALLQHLPMSRRSAADTALWRALLIARYPTLVRHRWGYGGRGVTASRYWQPGMRHTSNLLERLWWIATLLEGPWPHDVQRAPNVRELDDDGHLVTRVCLENPGLATALFARTMAHYPPLARACTVMLHDRGQRELEHVLPHVRTAFSVAVLETQPEDALRAAVAWALDRTEPR